MKFSSIMRVGLALSLLICLIIAFAANQPTTKPLGRQQELAPHSTAKELIVKTDKIYDPNVLTLDSIQTYEARFDFDWNNHTTIPGNKNKIEEIEAFLKTNPDFSKLSNAEQQSLGRMLYKLGTFYTHVSRQPDLAIEIMDVADKYLKNKTDKAWNYNTLALAYEQKFFQTRRETDDKKGFYYTNKVIYDLYQRAQNKEVAFAYCVQGILRNDEKNYGLAENSFKTALNIYEKIPYVKDDQYLRAKNRLANVILAMNGRDLEAISMFEEIKKYWLNKPNYTQNPYAARNLISLGQAYFKVGDVAKGAEQIENSINIYQNVYGKKSELLVKPFTLLSEAYKKLDNDRLSEACEKKAKEIEPSNLNSLMSILNKKIEH